MKKLITLLFSVGLVTAVFAQTGDRHRNDSRSNDNSYQSSPYSNNDQYNYPDQYSNEDRYNSNSQWNERGHHNQFERNRQRMARQRYEMMMMRRNQERYHNQRRYDSYSPYGVTRRPGLQIRIGIGSRSRY
jgi:hypothetical protein